MRKKNIFMLILYLLLVNSVKGQNFKFDVQIPSNIPKFNYIFIILKVKNLSNEKLLIGHLSHAKSNIEFVLTNLITGDINRNFHSGYSVGELHFSKNYKGIAINPSEIKIDLFRKSSDKLEEGKYRLDVKYYYEPLEGFYKRGAFLTSSSEFKIYKANTSNDFLIEARKALRVEHDKNKAINLYQKVIYESSDISSLLTVMVEARPAWNNFLYGNTTSKFLSKTKNVQSRQKKLVNILENTTDIVYKCFILYYNTIKEIDESRLSEDELAIINYKRYIAKRAKENDDFSKKIKTQKW